MNSVQPCLSLAQGDCLRVLSYPPNKSEILSHWPTFSTCIWAQPEFGKPGIPWTPFQWLAAASISLHAGQPYISKPASRHAGTSTVYETEL